MKVNLVRTEKERIKERQKRVKKKRMEKRKYFLADAGKKLHLSPENLSFS